MYLSLEFLILVNHDLLYLTDFLHAEEYLFLGLSNLIFYRSKFTVESFNIQNIPNLMCS